MLIKKIITNINDYSGSVAVVANGEKLTYSELGRRSKALARNLRLLGIGRGDVVAIFSDRSADTIVGIVGVMLSAAAYTIVELDGNMDESITKLTSIDPTIVISNESYSDVIRESGLLHYSHQELSLETKIDQLSEASLADMCRSSGNDTAYILYTSGSTGTPKGVCVTHDNIAHYVESIASVTQVNRGLNYAHLSTLAADLGNTSLFLSLHAAGSIHLLDGLTRKDPRALVDYIRSESIGFIKITPSHWKAIFSAFSRSGAIFPRLSHLIFGGEPLRADLISAAIEADVADNIFNHYGPTEATIGVTAYPVKRNNKITKIDADLVPIGFPFGETKLLVKTAEDQYRSGPCKGELYIGGPSVAAGYLGLVEQTRDKFLEIECGLDEKLRVYKTGDYVELDKDGKLNFIGRVDRQVKINGYRVELESIENTMRSLEHVKDASVAYLEIIKRNKLAAVIVVDENFKSLDTMKAELEKLIPAYMIPSRIYILEGFPRNPNGKTNVKEIEVFLREKLAGEHDDLACVDLKSVERKVYGGARKDAYEVIFPIYRKYCAKSCPGENDNFYELGGNSLDAVQLIADLQFKGVNVSANDFFEIPTLDGLIESVVRNSEYESNRSDVQTNGHREIYRFSAAQEFFFRENHIDPDVYNQAVLFEIRQAIDIDVFERALELVIEQHELLATSFNKSGSEWVAVSPSPIQEKFLSVSDTSGAITDEDFTDIVDRTSQGIQNSISLATGAVFKAHIFKSSGPSCQLLMVAHHLCVDIISWRIILSELTRVYCDLLEGLEIPKKNVRHSFWDWVNHFENKNLIASTDSVDTRRDSNASVTPLNTPFEHTEQETETYWLGYTQDQTLRLDEISANIGVPIHLIFLAVLSHELGKIEMLDNVVIDVESHGRIALDRSVDISRVVGWHTSTFPLNIAVDRQFIDKTIKNTKLSYDEVENLGVSESWDIHNRSGLTGGISSTICFNFLGDIDFPHDDRIDIQASSMKVGRTRGGKNIRYHNIKVSLQKINKQYIVDISYPGNLDSKNKNTVLKLLSAYQASLNEIVGSEDDYMPSLTEKGSATGAIHYCPKELLRYASEQQVRQYSSILLTGATGFIGVYCLRELLRNTTAEVTCIVRPESDKSGLNRFEDNWAWYFSPQELSLYSDRINVLDGDLTEVWFGVGENTYGTLSNSVDAIYHFAADTRLVGSEREFFNSNLKPLEKILAFSKGDKIKDLHYMSTLAVCGVVEGKNPAVFSEDSLDIGQKFQNAYEKTKFVAEQLINSHALDGYPVYTYRTGNVSGDSKTGLFQKNASANRLVQFLNACSKLGMLPLNIDERVNLSPIDIVCNSVVGLSLDATQSSGVYHVDTPHYFSIREIFRELERQDFKFNQSKSKDFGELFQVFDGTSDSDLALGRFWSLRRPRNVVFDHSKSLRRMKKMGLEFPEPSPEWLARFVGDLLEKDAISRPNADSLHLGQFTRSRIFSVPYNPAHVLKNDAVHNNLS